MLNRLVSRVLASWLLLLASVTVQATQLVELAPSDSGHTAVLVGGLGNTHVYFESWVLPLSSQGKRVLGFEHDHRTVGISEGARALALELSNLHTTRHLVIHAHSMGGLLAKRALQLLQDTQELSRFESVTLHTYGTPWGGFFAANFARWIPLPEALERSLGIAMAREIGSLSPFIQAVAAPLPGDVVHVVHEGSKDTVGMPSSDIGRAQYHLALSVATRVVRYDGVDHDGFAPHLLAQL